MARIDAFLKLGLAQGCSDIHLAVGVPPMLRMNGDLMPIKFRELSDTELETYILEILTAKQQDILHEGHDLDFSYVADGGGRFRVNVFRKATGYGAVFRFIPGDVPTLEQLNVPPILEKFCDYHQGMVLVTGSTGTGKSTTLAAMIDHSMQRVHLISSVSKTRSSSCTQASKARSFSARSVRTLSVLPMVSAQRCVKTLTSSWLANYAMPKPYRWQ